MIFRDIELPPGIEGRAWRHISPGAVHARHYHHLLELNLVTAGSGTALIGGWTHRIGRGCVSWIPPGVPHVLLQQSPDLRMWIVHALPAMVRRCELSAVLGGGDVHESAHNAPLRVLRDDRLQPLERFLAELVPTLDEVPRFNAGLAYSLLSTWSACEATARESQSRSLHPAVRQATQILQEERGQIAIGALAERVGLCTSRLSQLFNQQMGISVAEYRSRARIDRFLELYDQADPGTMAEVAASAGFGSYPQFHRVFKKIMGVNPAQYRREVTAPPEPAAALA